MGIAALIIGIIAVILGFVPLCGIIALVPAIVGIVLGIVDMKKKAKANESKTMGLTGVILNGVAIVVILVWTLVIGAAARSASGDLESGVMDFQEQMGEVGEQMQKAIEEAQEAAEDAMEEESDTEF